MMDCSPQFYPCGSLCIPKLVPCEGSCQEDYIRCGDLCLEEEFHWRCGDGCLYLEEPCENFCPENFILCGDRCTDIQSIERDIDWFENSCKYRLGHNQWILSSVILIFLLSIIKKYL